MDRVETVEKALRRIWSFSKALDLALIDEEVKKGLELEVGYRHGERVGYMAVRLGYILGLRGKDLIFLLVAALLHDIGAVGGFADYHGKPELMEYHSELGAEIFEKIFPHEGFAEVLRNHHKTPADGLDISLEAKIISLADKVDIIMGRNPISKEERAGICREIRLADGIEYYPEVTGAFLQLAEEEAFWLYMKEDDLLEPTAFMLLSDSNGQFYSDYRYVAELMYSDAITDKLAETFAFLIDQKSSYTGKHSRTVAENACLLAEGLGWDAEKCREIKLAGLLHDLGKLAVPKKILDKPEPLGEEEFQIVKIHTFHTYNLLSMARFSKNIVEWASYHHERLDGTGYPFRKSANTLSTGARLMAIADIFTALTEDRPYRRAISRERAMVILEKNAGTWVDRELLEVARRKLL
ncbi:MAG: HD domain-containing protein [Peptococcaceae bacterium]|nr:HD domain-containing protein [Peptococcaceae bacterium]